MQLIITDAWLIKSRAIHLSGINLLVSLLVASFFLVLFSIGVYHWIFLKGAKEGWPLVGSVVQLVKRDEVEEQNRFLRENIEVLAKKLGEVQAKMLQLESLGERVSGLAGVNPAEIKVPPHQGGRSVLERDLSMQDIQTALADFDKQADQSADWMALLESKLFEQKIKKMMFPTQSPIPTAHVGSSFGWRIDPFSGRSALHTGLDFASPHGTDIYAAAGGIVVTQQYLPEYGNTVDIDHGNDLVSRYAHVSKFHVKKGDLIRRGQKIAEVGNTGRSTGAHLHFEVLVNGIPQDPKKFLNAGRDVVAASASTKSRTSHARHN